MLNTKVLGKEPRSMNLKKRGADELETMNWEHAMLKIKETWLVLTDEEREKITRKRNQLIGQIQINYRIEKEAAETLVEDWEKTHDSRLILDFIT